MRRLKQDLDEVTEQLRQEQHQRVQNECQIRQDMLLEKLQAEKKAQCETEKLERHLRMAWKVIDQKVRRIWTSQGPRSAVHIPSAAC